MKFRQMAGGKWLMLGGKWQEANDGGQTSGGILTARGLVHIYQLSLHIYVRYIFLPYLDRMFFPIEYTLDIRHQT